MAKVDIDSLLSADDVEYLLHLLYTSKFTTFKKKRIVSVIQLPWRTNYGTVRVRYQLGVTVLR